MAATLVVATSAGALDLFTLWQRPELPLNLAAGLRADYRRQALTEGRRTDDLLRVQCLGRDAAGRWVLEVLPLVEVAPDSLAVVPGEGLRLHLSRRFEERRGNLSEAVAEVVLWRDGQMSRLDEQEWRQDPLVTASFSGDFVPQTVTERAPTVRVIGTRELTCRQLEFAAADTQRARLPAGTMVQISSQEVAAAVHPDIPLLGLAYVTERLRAESHLEPASDRFPPPPLQLRVEMLECLGFGRDARPWLGPFTAD
ncbi:MAG: hypothetical protein R3D98_07185 [Candidatus Krumholzibacteriia bacterium]